MIKNIKFNFDLSVFLNADYSTHEGSCIKHQVYELTDIHQSYGGFPNSYCFENTKIHQLWWYNSQVNFDQIGELLGIDVITISSIKQPPGCIIPLHRDTFYQISQRFPDRKGIKVRANIYLEDWKIGHFIQYNDNVSTHWKAGEGFIWDSSILHLSANAGMQNKYTLQVSGFLK